MRLSFGLICDGTKFGLICDETKFGLICDGTKFGLICDGTKFGLICDGTKFGLICDENKFGLICDGTKFGLICDGTNTNNLDECPGSPPEGSSSNSGTTLKPYLRRKKSSLGETKIAVLGMAGVGKSALCVRFLTKRFIGEYDQASENKYKCATTLEGESVTFELLDTRSAILLSRVMPDKLDHRLLEVSPDRNWLSRDARQTRPPFAFGKYSFVLAYGSSLKDHKPRSRRRLEDMKKVNHVPVILLGNKADLAHVRQVTQDEGARLAAELSCSFMEVSASEDVTKVTDAFHTLCRRSSSTREGRELSLTEFSDLKNLED
ncbi:hypothetical protein Btru_057575 [Bulinus truncatus]|nr:hypothetical protein Btru_057575 [Bulinus truncatus]